MTEKKYQCDKQMHCDNKILKRVKFFFNLKCNDIKKYLEFYHRTIFKDLILS